MHAKLFISAIAAAAALALNAQAADVIHSGDTGTMGRWYGNAGGLSGSDRVGGLSVGKSVVTSGDVNSISRSYGNAGGLTGSDRVTGLIRGTTKAAGIEGAKSN